MLGLSIPEVAGRGLRLDAATAALVARMSVQPSGTRVRSIDAAVRALKAGGVWPKLAALYLIAAHDAQAARLNWVQPAYGLTAVNSPAFTTDRGYAGDGTAAYLDTGWSPSLGAQDSLCFGVWDRTGAQSTAGVAGTSAAPSVLLLVRSATDTAAVRVNQGAASASGAGSVTDGSGLTVANRSGASAVQIYRNGALLLSASPASTAPSTAPLTLGLFNASNFNAHQFAACVIGSSLDAGEQAALHGALLGYLTAVGAV
jgi:hypothetical protein